MVAARRPALTQISRYSARCRSVQRVRSAHWANRHALHRVSGEQIRQRLAAILAADVAGYSRLMSLDERATGIKGEIEEQRAIQFVRSYKQAWQNSHLGPSPTTTQQPETTDDSEDLELIAWQGLCRVLIASNEFLYLD